MKTKISAFKQLYNLDSSDTEKHRVRYFLDTHYTISSDADKRMKANDLYKEVINHLCIPYEESSAFKKRLAGYLIEFNLQKKRFSDAYYYYGINKKEYPKVTLDEIEEKRREEKKTFMFGSTIPKMMFGPSNYQTGFEDVSPSMHS
jgi:hypothetical protein